MKCPRCDGSTSQIDRGGVQLDTCTSCSGFWLDKGELDQLVAEKSPRTKHAGAVPKELRKLLRRGWATTGEAALTCPRCQVAMEKVAFTSGASKVLGDRCAACGGFWLDPGELGSVFVLVQDALE